MPTPHHAEKARTIPRPRAPIDPRKEPFVGNATTDDNLAEAIEVAIWTVAGESGRRIEATVNDGVVQLSGTLENMASCKAIAQAVASVSGVREVVNRLIAEAVPPASNSPAATGQWRAKGRPLLSVTRFCGTDEASLSAAIRDAVQRLDSTFATQGFDLPSQLFVIYRNLQQDTVTIEIGMPASAAVKAGGEFRRSMSPVGAMLSTPVDPGAEALMEAYGKLGDRARRTGFDPKRSRWQQFDAKGFRPWIGHPAHSLNVCVSRTA